MTQNLILSALSAAEASVWLTPGAGGDLWILGLIGGGLGTLLGAINMITTVVCMRAPGRALFDHEQFFGNPKNNCQPNNVAEHMLRNDRGTAFNGVVAPWPGGRVKRDRAQDQLHLQDRADKFFEQTYDPEQDPNPAPVNQCLHDRLSRRRTASARRPKRASTPPEETCSRQRCTHPAPTAIPGNREITG
jgi:hypothetical protein